MNKLLLIFFLFTFLGCETVHEGGKTVGSAIGKGADAIGGITEGAAEEYKGREAPGENPYGR
jgi:hypothetical protein